MNTRYAHWEQYSGEVLWSSFPEETISQGQKIVDREEHSREVWRKACEAMKNSVNEAYLKSDPDHAWSIMEMLEAPIPEYKP